ncbi:GGDEF domain-containing protein [Dysosmobacter sp.]|uniref:GGDEF domain-containing protein n=1 Tax=Dysosmobacter sp. TaxID=2591382 RepID=UPI002A8B955F|nr:GGDEF domain-containing protein [Dysosmobacter sp.]MDY3281849.1 GGDEF domain-containing protein [Dysosmobacter sp.]
MTKNEVCALMRQLEFVFDRVRLVDAAVETQFFLNDRGELEPEPYCCYLEQGDGARCGSCLSELTFQRKGRLARFEFSQNDVSNLMAKYVEVDGEPFVLEMMCRITDGVLFGAKGKNEFAEAITSYNRKLYVDPLTGAYNRQYYEEQLRELRGNDAVAMLDLDDFKSINDTRGHSVGDAALRAVIGAVIQCVRGTDEVIRYGGDEFLLVFRNIPRKAFAARLEQIRQTVENLKLEDQPNLHLSVSIGGVYRQGPVKERVQEADSLLYQAKNVKNCICLK